MGFTKAEGDWRWDSTCGEKFAPVKWGLGRPQEDSFQLPLIVPAPLWLSLPSPRDNPFTLVNTAVSPSAPPPHQKQKMRRIWYQRLNFSSLAGKPSGDLHWLFDQFAFKGIPHILQWKTDWLVLKTSTRLPLIIINTIILMTKTVTLVGETKIKSSIYWFLALCHAPWCWACCSSERSYWLDSD